MKIEDYIHAFGREHLSIDIIGPLYDPASHLPSEKISSGPKVFVDGGAKFRKGQEGFSIGDGDSFSGKLDQILNKDKNFSDLAFVLENLGENFEAFRLLGFSGGRKDHELMNWAEVHSFLKKRSRKAEVRFGRSMTAYSAGFWRFPAEGRFSLFAFEPVQMKLKGQCEYPLEGKAVFRPLSSHGLSNRGHGEIQLTCRGPVFVFF